MNAQEHTENVLRKIHILFAKASPYKPDTEKVVIDKTAMMELLRELNECMSEMMDECEITDRGREKARLDVKRQGEEIIDSSKKEADDIYAASIMYTDRALKSIQDNMELVSGSMNDMLMSFRGSMDKMRDEIRQNQLELRSQLQDMADSDKYMRLITDENIRIEREKKQTLPDSKTESDNPYKDIKPEIKINPAYFKDANEKESKEIEISDLDKDIPDKAHEVKKSVKKPFDLSGIFGRNKT